MAQCKCWFGPRCESNRNCVDQSATIGLIDRRTGEIRARADWSWLHPSFPSGRIVVKLFCNECYVEYSEALEKPLLGIDRPANASEFWRPSILEHIRLTAIRNNHEQRMQEAERAMQAAQVGDGFANERERRWTPGQRSQALFMRRRMREIAAENRAAR